jgi:hypothetical protein
MPQPRGKNWGLQAALCAAVVAWQAYDIASATEEPRQAVALMQYFVIGSGLVGLVSALVLMAKGKPQ